MKLTFKKTTCHRKGDTTYCTIIVDFNLSASEHWIRISNGFTRKYGSFFTYDHMPKQFVNYHYFPQGCDIEVICVGKAEKSPSDIDNPEMARRLAEARAKSAIYNYAVKLIDALFWYCRDLAYGDSFVMVKNLPEDKTEEKNHNTGLDGQYDKYVYLAESEDSYINKLLSRL